MGRSVSYATGSVAKVYYNVSGFGYAPDDESDDESVYCEYLANEDWDEFVASLQEQISSLWPSMSACDVWVGSEDHAIMENNHAFIGVSEYCGLACVWLLPKEGNDSGDALARAWCNRIAPKFNRMFGDLVRIGQFSNGEAVFEQKQSR